MKKLGKQSTLHSCSRRGGGGGGGVGLSVLVLVCHVHVHLREQILLEGVEVELVDAAALVAVAVEHGAVRVDLDALGGLLTSQAVEVEVLDVGVRREATLGCCGCDLGREELGGGARELRVGVGGERAPPLDGVLVELAHGLDVEGVGGGEKVDPLELEGRVVHLLALAFLDGEEALEGGEYAALL